MDTDTYTGSEEQYSLQELMEKFQKLAIYFRDAIIGGHDSIEKRTSSKSALEEFLSEYQEMTDISGVMNYVFEPGTVLHMAVRYGRDDLIPLFIRYGADPNFRPEEGGLSAVDVAMQYDNLRVIELLRPNQTNASTAEAVIVLDPFDELALTGLRDDLGIAGDSSS